MLSIFSNTLRAYGSAGSAFVHDLEQENARNEAFFKEVESWRNIEFNYIAKINQVATNLRDKGGRPLRQTDEAGCAGWELSKMLLCVADHHKSFLSKVNFDIFLVNFQMGNKLIQASKRLLEEEKQQQKEIHAKRELLQRVLSKKEKLKRQREEELILQIFMSDSVETTMDQKIRKKNKIKELEKEIDEYHLKVSETIEDYRKLHDKNNATVVKLKQNLNEQERCKNQTLLKINLHCSTYWKNLSNSYEEISKAQGKKPPTGPQELFDRLQRKEDDVLKKLCLDKIGFMENSLRMIGDNSIDDLIEYSRDRDVKSRIKRMMETNEVDPTETDQASRQVKLIKKILTQQIVEPDCIAIFRSIINKNSKLRMNFVFVLQFFRINNQFQISINQISNLHWLISEFLSSCYENRDSFVLKQLMILLMTYYVSHKTQIRQSIKKEPIQGQKNYKSEILQVYKEKNEFQKIYIIHFFKKDALWKDIEYWESVLVQCIYLEKRNTIKMMMVNDSGNPHRRKELQEAERSAILNQVLMVVRNMVIFEFTQKEVKSFAGRFIKLLKQDEKFQKDVYVQNTIQDAAKEELKLHEQQKESIKQFYLLNLIKDRQEQSYIPFEVRKSYTQ